MRNEKFRKALAEALGEFDELDAVILDNHDYDGSIIGVTEDGRLVYDLERMYAEFAKDEGCDIDEAVEWVEYNTLRALPYMGEKAPIILSVSKEEIMERYGD